LSMYWIQARELIKRVSKSPATGRVLSVIRKLTPIAALGIITYLAWESRDVLASTIRTAQWGYLAASVIACLGPYFLGPLGGVIVLTDCGADIAYEKMLRIHLDCLPARYLPGGIWGTVGRFLYLHGHGINPSQLGTLAIVENVMPIASCFVLGGGWVWYSHGLQDRIGVCAALSVIAGAIMLVGVPRAIAGYLSTNGERLSLAGWAKCVGIGMVFYALGGLSFACYMTAFPSSIEHLSLVDIGGSYLFSYGVGYIAFFSPQGIGVVEVMAGHLLKGAISLESMIVLVAGFRLIPMLTDILLWITSRCFYCGKVMRFRQRPSKALDSPESCDEKT